MPTKIHADYYTAEEYAAAKEVNIAAFLLSIGYELVRTGNWYRGKAHDSLAIRADGHCWYWNSLQVKGYSPIELYKQILLHDFGYHNEIAAAIAAVKQLAGGRGAYITTSFSWDSSPSPAPRAAYDPLILPAPYKENRRAMTRRNAS